MGLAVSLIDLDHLSRHYGRRRGIERVSLFVREGDLFGFLGPNGAGKTTTIRVMLGFLSPSAGAAKIFGLDCWEGSRVIKRQVGYLPGDLRLPAWMNGSSALSIFGAVRGLELARAGQELAEKFDLDLGVKVREMSRGMRSLMCRISIWPMACLIGSSIWWGFHRFLPQGPRRAVRHPQQVQPGGRPALEG